MQYLSIKEYLENVGISLDEILGKVKYNSNDIVLLTGSLANNHGTPMSDLDVHVISKSVLNESDMDGHNINSGLIIKNIQSNGINIDIEYVDENHLIDAVSKRIDISTDNYKSRNIFGQSHGEGFSDSEIITLHHRVYTGTCIFGHKFYDEVFNKINNNNYWNWKSKNILLKLEGQYDDLIGFMEIGDVKSAKLLAIELAKSLAYAILTKSGCSMDRMKWVLVNLSRYSDDSDLKHISKIIDEIILYNKDATIFELIDFYDKTFKRIINE